MTAAIFKHAKRFECGFGAFRAEVEEVPGGFVFRGTQRERVTPKPWAKCPSCAGVTTGKVIIGTARGVRKCTTTCGLSTAAGCDCSCGGTRHGTLLGGAS